MAEPHISRITVLVSSYQYGEFLADCLESVLAQILRPSRLLVVDDHSTDDSGKILAGFRTRTAAADIDYQYHIEARNLGQNGLLNKYLPGIDTPYCVLLDADDRLQPSYLQQTWRALRRDQSADRRIGFCHSQIQLIDREGNPMGRARLVADRPEWRYLLPRTALIETALLKKALPLVENTTRNTKYGLWRRILATGRTGTLCARPMFDYRIHDRNVSGIQRLMQTGKGTDILLQQHWYQLAKESGLPL